jgi:hypothetical protein
MDTDNVTDADRVLAFEPGSDDGATASMASDNDMTDSQQVLAFEGYRI